MNTVNIRSRVALSEWTILSVPVAATRATATIAAGGAGVRRVLEALEISVSPIAAQGELELQVRDGTTGAGIVLWKLDIIVPIAGESILLALSDIGIIGSPNTAMTIELSVAPAATNFQRVNASGYNAL